MCYNISHVGAGIPVDIYVLLAHEYQEMLETNPTNLPALFLRPAGSDNIQFLKIKHLKMLNINFMFPL